MKYFSLLFIFCCTLALLAYPSQTQATVEEAAITPRVGLVLGGGGAKALAHIGVLKYLEEHQIPVDFVVGTSMGAVAGGLYVQGVAPEELENMVLSVDWLHLFTDTTRREFRGIRRKEEDRSFPLQFTVGFSDRQFKLPSGVIRGQHFMPLLRNYAVNYQEVQHFDDYALPFRATATDIETGEMVILEQGDITLAIRASMAIPGIFTPVNLNGRVLIDGCVTNNLPIDVALGMGATQLIVVDLSDYSASIENINGPLGMVERAVRLMIRNNSIDQSELLRTNDIHLIPDFSSTKVATRSFDKALDAMNAGYKAAAQHANALQALAVDNATWQQYQQRLRNQHKEFTPSWFDLHNESDLPDDLILTTIKTEPGEPISLSQLNDEVERIYGLGYFEQVDYRVAWDDHGNSGVELHTTPRSWGPDYLSFGLSLEENFDTESNYRAAVSYLRTAINKYGAEFQTDLQIGSEPILRAKYWHPLRRDARAYSSVRAGLVRNNVNYFLNGKLASRVQISRQTLGFDLGTHWKHTADVRLSYDYGTGQARGLNPITEQLEHVNFETAQLTVSTLFDSLDSVHLPKKGSFVELNYALSDKAIGADSNYQHLQFQYLGAHTWGDHTLVAGTHFHSTIAGTSPFYDNFSLGGFMNLSGYEYNEFSGQHVAFGQLVYLNRLPSSRRFGAFPMYIGAAIEAGQAWERSAQVQFSDLIYSGSLMGVINTPIGPIYLGISRSSQGRSGAYLAVGRPF